jgi:hypothetical protein
MRGGRDGGDQPGAQPTKTSAPTVEGRERSEAGFALGVFSHTGRRTLGPVKVTRLRIDGQEFYLPQEVDVPALQRRILAAVHGEAAFVTFRPIGHGDITVLVTPQIPIRFEIEDRSDEQLEEWATNPPAIDLGEYFHDLESE